MTSSGLIETVDDFAREMATLVRDLRRGTVTPQVANASANCGGKMLRARELQEKYGHSTPGNGAKRLLLIDKQLESPARKR